MLVFKADNQQKYEFVPLGPKKDRLELMQKQVGGSLAILPHFDFGDAPFMAYANGDGIDLNLTSNFFSWGVLRNLGFMADLQVPFHFGNVILMKQGGKPLSKADIAKVDAAVREYDKQLSE
jgi:hypothetical protein